MDESGSDYIGRSTQGQNCWFQDFSSTQNTFASEWVVIFSLIKCLSQGGAMALTVLQGDWWVLWRRLYPSRTHRSYPQLRDYKFDQIVKLSMGLEITVLLTGGQLRRRVAADAIIGL